MMVTIGLTVRLLKNSGEYVAQVWAHEDILAGLRVYKDIFTVTLTVNDSTDISFDILEKLAIEVAHKMNISHVLNLDHKT